MTVAATPVVWGALALRPQGSGVQTYERELIRAAANIATDREFAAVVQSDTVAGLPGGVRAIRRPVCSGARRALHALRPVSTRGIFHSLDGFLYTDHLIGRNKKAAKRHIRDEGWGVPGLSWDPAIDPDPFQDEDDDYDDDAGPHDD